MSEKALLEVKDLSVEYHTDEMTVKAVNGVSLSVGRGQTLGLVGETGAGKTTLALSLLRLLPKGIGKITSGAINFEGANLLSLREADMRAYRGRLLSMIFQDPMTSLNPVIPVGRQVAEVLELHNDKKLTKQQIEARVDDMFRMVGIPPERKNEYPHQFSGGMKQRVVIAISLACEPELLIADEPTTALDVTIQAQVLAMMTDLKEKLGTSMIMITHDLGIVAETCDSVAVMYAGEIVEMGTVEALFEGDTHHPYTEGLFGSIPRLDVETERLRPIDGMIADPSDLPGGCSFHPRCPYCTERCKTEHPQAHLDARGHMIRCHRFDKEGEA
ncbi:MAG TPA: ABC transporter ATP-binding protein [Candidatus Pullichristensenella stercorigallinarum]|uniref:Nickel import system ATP-binding protein NikD n=1 Tax=Candidatus Pullichristensenella stercorigallinarum TaxID=2840909 RepID=A0A9D0ZL90_9FIRM|nr:ABC transporter ATP-binding protein [Candidatus Pullichristensenella stercorigallinarum]